jgi:hypothetical protein
VKTNKKAIYQMAFYSRLITDHLQQALFSAPAPSLFLLQQAQPHLQPQPHLPLMRYLINAAIDNTIKTFMKMHITIACTGT